MEYDDNYGRELLTRVLGNPPTDNDMTGYKAALELEYLPELFTNRDGKVDTFATCAVAALLVGVVHDIRHEAAEKAPTLDWIGTIYKTLGEVTIAMSHATTTVFPALFQTLPVQSMIEGQDLYEEMMTSVSGMKFAQSMEAMMMRHPIACNGLTNFGVRVCLVKVRSLTYFHSQPEELARAMLSAPELAMLNPYHNCGSVKAA